MRVLWGLSAGGLCRASCVLVSRLGDTFVALVASRAVGCSSRFASLVARVVPSLGYELTVLLFRSGVAWMLPLDSSCTCSVFRFVVRGQSRQGCHWVACHQVAMRFRGDADNSIPRVVGP